MKRIKLLIIVFLLSFKICLAPTFITMAIIQSSPLTKGFLNYADDLGWYESRNNPKKMPNSIGCFAEHQWKESTLKFLGYHVSLVQFKKDPTIFPRSMQLDALKKLTRYNIQLLQDCNDYIGTSVKGIRVTQSGMAAAAHLGGSNNVRIFLKTHGRVNKKDINGTSIATYLERFQDYNLKELNF